MRNKKGFLLTFIIFDEKSLVLEKKACNTVFWVDFFFQCVRLDKLNCCGECV